MQSAHSSTNQNEMNLNALRDAALRVMQLREDYKSKKKVGGTERSLDPILYAYMDGHFGHVRRQHNVHVYGGKAKCIDYRRGTSNPTVIELVVRPDKGGGVLAGSQNRDELHKLCRVTKTEARYRILLLIDLCSYPLSKDALKATYDAQPSRPGNYRRHSVRVLYVHRDLQYSFLWQP